MLTTTNNIVKDLQTKISDKELHKTMIKVTFNKTRTNNQQF